MTPNWKPCATERKLKHRQTRRDARTSEDANKQAARKRDSYKCRFPLCGCRRAGLRLEVSHQEHKGAGGNPSGSRSQVKGLITLCVHRHQDGAVSIHKGTLKIKPLTTAGTNGPVAFLVDRSLVWPQFKRDRWFQVAQETAVQQLAPPSPVQQAVLERLAELAI